MALVMTDDDIELIRQAIDECTPDLEPLSEKYAGRRAGFRRATAPEVLVRGERLAKTLAERRAKKAG